MSQWQPKECKLTLGALVTVTGECQWHKDWRDEVIRVIGLDLQPDGTTIATVADPEPGGFGWLNSTDGFSADELTLFTPPDTEQQDE